MRIASSLLTSVIILALAACVAAPQSNAEPTLPAEIPAEAEAESAEDTSGTALDLSGNPNLDYAQVTFVRATQSGDGSWRFDTTVHHNDQGWDHYADAWQVITMEGEVLAERVLLHPHDNEQPFTRSQSGVEIPTGMTQVIVRAKCNVHGFGGQEVLVDLTMSTGENFEVVAN